MLLSLHRPTSRSYQLATWAQCIFSSIKLLYLDPQIQSFFSKWTKKWTNGKNTKGLKTCEVWYITLKEMLESRLQLSLMSTFILLTRKHWRQSSRMLWLITWNAHRCYLVPGLEAALLINQGKMGFKFIRENSFITLSALYQRRSLRMHVVQTCMKWALIA